MNREHVEVSFPATAVTDWCTTIHAGRGKMHVMTTEEFYSQYHIQLTDQQKTAMETVDGPVLLLAVPGSGKTTVLVSRIGYMIYCKGIRPENILTLTYTVAATRDMGERFRSVFGGEMADRLQFRTINGICAMIINYFGRQIGRNSFSLVSDEKDSAPVLSRIYQQVQNEYATEADLKNVRTMIAYIKNMMLGEKEIRALDENNDGEIKISEIYRLYNNALKSQKLMDYDDQMIYALLILEKYPQVLSYFQELYPYILVDEAQDTSKIQHKIIALLSGQSDNLFMVGDEDQSIYGFRAAYPQALLEFQKVHKNAQVLLMEENFRSNAKIVEAADRFIALNVNRHEKHMKASRPEGADIRMISLKSRNAQYNYLAKVAASTAAAADANAGETAVLYRDNESMLPLVDLLERQGISFRLRQSDLLFFTHRTVQDIRNIVAFARHPDDTDLFMQVYYKISTYMSKAMAMESCRSSARHNIPVLDAALDYGSGDGRSAKNLKTIRTHLKNLLNDTASEGINRIVFNMGYQNYLERSGLSDSKIKILRALSYQESSVENLFVRLEELQSFLKSRENDLSCPFVMSTIHASKGLEYDTVYLMDVIDGIFPKEVPSDLRHMSPEEQNTYEEERRLFYVGITRAKNNLNVFTYDKEALLSMQLRDAIESDRDADAGWRSSSSYDDFGGSGGRFGSDLDDLDLGPSRGYDYATRRSRASRGGSSYLKSAESAVSREDLLEYRKKFRLGQTVNHRSYGEGMIVEISDVDLSIRFPDKTRKFKLAVLLRKGLL